MNYKALKSYFIINFRKFPITNYSYQKTKKLNELETISAGIILVFQPGTIGDNKSELMQRIVIW